MSPKCVSKFRQYIAYFLIACLQLQVAQPAFAQYSATEVNPVQAIPPNIKSTSPRPMIMLNMSKDHQLFYRAYTEFADINGDGMPDTTYLSDYNYTGYFDYAKCYIHNGSEFTPSSIAATSTITVTNTATNTVTSTIISLCNQNVTNEWSGNFLNWSTMTRMDLVRKVLYGGKRSVDTTTKTVLERAALPNDAHSFAKYYAGTAAVPINKVTPFTPSTGQITLCNTTNGANTEYSHTSNAAPLIKVANGNYSLWNAGERWQCQWKEEMSLKTAGQNNGDNSNVPTITGINASSDSPSTTVRLGGGNLIARVEVCKSPLIGNERCKQYGTNYKPIGLLQEYGENDSAEFGLITGSFSKNISGGVLRRNMGSFKTELDTSTGVFSTSTKGIVYTLDKLRVFGYRYTDGVYGNPEDGECYFGLSGLKDDQCASWGNPLGEMFVESLNYLAANGQSTEYISSATAQDPKGTLMGLGVETWVDPMKRGATVDGKFGKPICRPLNILNFNASVISYDGDSITNPFAKLTSTTLNSQINAVGIGENINGKSWFIGSNGTTSNRLCNDKVISNLSDATGLCPDAAGYSGSFSLPGAAYWAHTNAIRTDITSTAVLKPFRVNTYGVALSSGKARIEIPISVSGATKTVVIQPAMRNSLSGGAGAGTLVDFRVVSVSDDRRQGKYLVIWEDSEQGGDYDQDMGGILSYEVQSDGSVKVTTDAYAQSTPDKLGFGYVISGTTKDGVHFHSGINGFAYTDLTSVAVTSTSSLTNIINASGGCSNCVTADSATSVTYPIGISTAGSLKDPLFYAAKWGGFDASKSNTISSADQWDARKKGGATGSDGIPDNFFEVFKTDELEAALRAAFDAILATSNSAPATSSSQLQAGGFKYIAKFDPDLKNGSLDAYKVLSDGSFSDTAAWKAQEYMSRTETFALRNVITDNGIAGIQFNWGTLPADYKTALKSVATGMTDSGAESLVNYMRGERVKESLSGLRERKTNILGTIVNSTPWLQSPPTAKLVGTQFPGYAAFLRTKANRSKVIWVGSNDGMMHAFDALNGQILTSYAPGMLAPRFYETTRQDATLLTENDRYRALVDGSPMTADIGFTTGSGTSATTTWSTYLFSSLGRGGKGVFALDVSDPNNLVQTNAASIFKWKFTDADMGYNINDPILHPQSGQAGPIAKMNNGKFALLQPNGVKSPTGKSKIYVLYAEGPNSTNGSWTGLYDTLDTESTGTFNVSGMSGVNWVDTDGNGTADIIYGTDVDGRLWKFDVSSANPTDWKSSYLSGGKPAPLYTTKNDASAALPITTSPVFSFPPIGGILLTFATGKSLENGDFGPTTLKNRIYSVWDRPEFSLATGARSLPSGTSTFEPREYIRQVDQSVKISTTTTAIDWTTRDGWFANFPTGGEMSVSNAELRGDTVYLIAIRPNLTDDCSSSPLTTLYLLDPLTGKASKSIVNPDNVVGVGILDQKIRVVEDNTGKITGPKTCTKGDPGCVCVGVDKSEVCTKPPPCTESGAERGFGDKTDLSLCIKQKNARFQWREIPGLQTTTKP